MGVLSAIGGAVGMSMLDNFMGLGPSMIMQKRQHDLNRRNYERRYQDTVKDMRLAGLNPILAATGGGMSAGSPAPTGLPISNTSSALDYMRHSVEEKNIKSQIKDRLNQQFERNSNAIKNWSIAFLNKQLGGKYDSDRALNEITAALNKIKIDVQKKTLKLLDKDMDLKDKEIMAKGFKAELGEQLGKELKYIKNELKRSKKNPERFLNLLIRKFFFGYDLFDQMFNPQRDEPWKGHGGSGSWQ
jgi:hypothetical protein